jgi:hypothetical protein
MVPAVVSRSEFGGRLSAESVVTTRAFLRGEVLPWLDAYAAESERSWISGSSSLSQVELLLGPCLLSTALLNV